MIKVAISLFCLVSLLTTAVALGSFERPQESLASDSLSHPPLRQTVEQGDYQLVIEAVDQWQTERAIAHLYKDQVLQWSQPIPHAYGPRFMVLSPDGQVLLLDEFINVASPQAIFLISAAGEVTAQHSFEDISRTIGVSAADLTRQSASGWWISAAPDYDPTDDPDNNQVRVQTGGKTLEIDIITGHLSDRTGL